MSSQNTLNIYFIFNKPKWNILTQNIILSSTRLTRVEHQSLTRVTIEIKPKKQNLTYAYINKRASTPTIIVNSNISKFCLQPTVRN